MNGQRDRILEMLREGTSFADISTATGVSQPTISYHANKNGLGRKLLAKTIDWAAVQAYHDAGHIRADCIRKFTMARESWDKAVRRGQLTARSFTKPLSEVTSRTTARHRLLREGGGAGSCQTCGVSEWMGASLVLQLDHINGINNDNRRENLRWLCPNCHSQTSTFCGRNKAIRGRLTVGREILVLAN